MVWSTTGRFLRNTARKRLVWLTLILAAAIAVFIFNSQKEEVKRELPLAQRQKHPLLEDKDNDGLQAWEEGLYRTDPANQDTDGDGASDGDEVKASRNPLVKGPNDTITDIKQLPEEEKNKSETEQVNLTQELFNELVKSGGVSAITKKGNAPLVSSIITQKIDELASSGKLNPSSYLGSTPSPIKTNEDKSPEAIKRYLNQVADIFEKHIAPLQTDDLDLFLEILQSGNLERLSELSPYREAALAVSSKIQELTVPKILAWFHQRQIFYLEESARQIQAMERAEIDPVTALVIAPQRLDLKVEVIKLYRGELKLWLQAQKISLTPNEKAYYLIN